MPSIEKIKSCLNKIWDILKVVSVLFLIGSTVASAIVWLAVNVFYPESIAIEVMKYFLLILVPITVSAIMLQAYKNSHEKKTKSLEKEINKIEELNTQVKNLSETTRQTQKNFDERLQKIHNNLQYFNNIFAYPCPNCKSVIWLDIPFAMVKEIHVVDGLPKGKFLQGREKQVICEKCKNAYHIVYP